MNKILKKFLVTILVVLVTYAFAFGLIFIIKKDQAYKYKIRLNDSTIVIGRNCYTSNGFVKFIDKNNNHIILPSDKVLGVEEFSKDK